MTDSEALERLTEHFRQLAILTSIDALLAWDERCLLPPAAGAYRAEQMTHLATIVHERRTDPRVGEWLERLAASSLAVDRRSEVGANIHWLKRDYDRARKLPTRLVEELARTAVLGQQVWQEARRDNDFARFQPLLEKTFALKREEAQAIGYEEHPYDALLDEYEPGAKTAEVAKILADLRDALVPLVAAIAQAPRRPDTSIVHREYPTARQEAFGKRAARHIGFDFDRGRLDVTAHPFCSEMGPDDCRITTRYDEKFFNGAFFGILHEAGHGLYEQGLPRQWHGLPAGATISLGIHESQSRMWENLVGRGRAFWNWLYADLKATFHESLSDVSVEAFHFAINDVKPSLIRVEADEATYNLHILVRFELERALVAGELNVADLPGAWNEKYRAMLGIDPPTDREGVLQDIHWAAGLVGYFPTYSLGNLYAAQFFERADHDLGGVHALIEGGDCRPLLEWLREKIHGVGRRWSAGELVTRVTGRPLESRPLMTYLRDKLSPLYGLA